MFADIGGIYWPYFANENWLGLIHRLLLLSSSFSVQGSVFSRIDALLEEFRVGGGVHDS